MTKDPTIEQIQRDAELRRIPFPLQLVDTREDYHTPPHLATRTHAGETWTLTIPQDADEKLLRALDFALLMIQGQAGIEAERQRL